MSVGAPVALTRGARAVALGWHTLWLKMLSIVWRLTVTFSDSMGFRQMFYQLVFESSLFLLFFIYYCFFLWSRRQTGKRVTELTIRWPPGAKHSLLPIDICIVQGPRSKVLANVLSTSQQLPARTHRYFVLPTNFLLYFYSAAAGTTVWL